MPLYKISGNYKMNDEINDYGCNFRSGNPNDHEKEYIIPEKKVQNFIQRYGQSISLSREPLINEKPIKTICKKGERSHYKKYNKKNNGPSQRYNKDIKRKEIEKKIESHFEREQQIPYGIEKMCFVIDKDNVILIKNSSSFYSMMFPLKNLLIGRRNYTSVYDVYQHFKLLEFCNKTDIEILSSKETPKEKKLFVQKCIARYGKSVDDIVRWRNEKGLQIIFDATYNKFSQNSDLLQQMAVDKDKLLIYAHENYHYDGCGKYEKLIEWLFNNVGKNVIVPVIYDLGNDNIFPWISEGKNIYGVILMLVRQKLICENRI
uniref:DUF1768 domain-containing protein n=1 Tax=Parastrongyloides trichosuri TaxID=131310 RepID=A0A0N4ZF92_PARTI